MASISRAEFLRLIALGVPAWAIAGSSPALAQTTADRRRQIAAVAGGDAHLNSFPLRQVNIQAAYIEADGKRIEGVPFFDGGFTGDTGIVGTLGSPESMADIAL